MTASKESEGFKIAQLPLNSKSETKDACDKAVKYLKESLKIEAKIKDLFEQMKELEGDLKKLTKRNLRILKKDKKRLS